MKKKVSIVGGGTAGLFLAAFLDTNLFNVTIYEKKTSFGRKFLVAGDGGFNLTHSENMDSFKGRYTPTSFLDEALDAFTNDDLRHWLDAIDIPTFVGSSKRVYPEKGIKPITVLNRIVEHLKDKGVQFCFGKTFTGWDLKDNLIFNVEEIVKSDFVVFALGGGSWKVTGSDGMWLDCFAKKGIETSPFEAANCAFKIDWPLAYLSKHEGSPLKNIAVSMGELSQKGEAVITRFGIEGNAIYALSPRIQAALKSDKTATVDIDFKPILSEATLLDKLEKSNLKTTQKLKQVIKLSANEIDLIKHHLSKDDFLNDSILVKTIKAFPLHITDAAPLDEAISTAGGISLSAVNSNFELKQIENQYCIGEMVAWNAPTGGYLIQASASMGAFLAEELNSRNR